MIIRHVSDTHGDFPDPTQDFDITIVSGDIFPDPKTTTYSHPAYPYAARTYQENWILNNKQMLIDWSQGKHTYFIPGNHDFVEPKFVVGFLDWISVSNTYQLHTHNPGLHEKDVSLYGFPYIPWICGTFNYELDDFGMLTAVQNMRCEFNEFGYPDILVCHAPPYGILDKAYEHLGNRRLLNMLTYDIHESLLPKLVLFGHIHENNGIEVKEFGSTKILFSNAATTHNYLEYK